MILLLFFPLSDSSLTAGTSSLHHSSSRYRRTLCQQCFCHTLILLVRDPRDVFLSITAFDKKRGFSGFSRRADDDDEDLC